MYDNKNTEKFISATVFPSYLNRIRGNIPTVINPSLPFFRKGLRLHTVDGLQALKYIFTKINPL